MIRSKLKEIAEVRGLSIRQIARDTDCHFETIRRIYNDDMQQYPRDVIDKLCTYLGIGVGDLLEYTQGMDGQDGEKNESRG